MVKGQLKEGQGRTKEGQGKGQVPVPCPSFVEVTPTPCLKMLVKMFKQVCNNNWSLKKKVKK